MEDLTGTFERRLDGKGRVVLPERFRARFAAGGYLTRGKLGAIELFPPEEYERKKARLREAADADDDDLKAHRKYRQFTAADFVTLDTQSRIAVSGQLQRYGRLAEGTTVVVVGADRTVELWHPDLWESEIADPGEGDLHRPQRPHTEDS